MRGFSSNQVGVFESMGGLENQRYSSHRVGAQLDWAIAAVEDNRPSRSEAALPQETSGRRGNPEQNLAATNTFKRTPIKSPACNSYPPALDLNNLMNKSGGKMKVVTYSHARNSLKSILDGVVQDADVTVISRRDAEGDAVVMSLDSYNSIMETLYLTSNPANAAALARAIAQDKAGQAQVRPLLEAD